MSAVVAFVAVRGSEPRLLAFCGCDGAEALALARAAADGGTERDGAPLLTALLDKAADGPRFCVATGRGTITESQRRSFRLLTAVARQGFELCGLRERPKQTAEQHGERTLEPLLPGFICASAAMARVTDQIQRVQGQTLTVLITGESGTGKDLDRAGDPRGIAAAHLDLPAVQLHHDDARVGRQPAVRPPARQLHRCHDRPAGPHPVGRGRDALP